MTQGFRLPQFRVCSKKKQEELLGAQKSAERWKKCK
jgi:hypothetical protein